MPPVARGRPPERLRALKPLPLRVLLVDDMQSVDGANRVPLVEALWRLVQQGIVDNVLIASVVETPGVAGLPDVVHHRLGAGAPVPASGAA